jgi:hypothetical protein
MSSERSRCFSKFTPEGKPIVYSENDGHSFMRSGNQERWDVFEWDRLNDEYLLGKALGALVDEWKKGNPKPLKCLLNTLRKKTDS